MQLTGDLDMPKRMEDTHIPTSNASLEYDKPVVLPPLQASKQWMRLQND